MAEKPKRTKRWQVLWKDERTGKHGVEDYATKTAANRRIRELTLQDISAQLWDVWNNPLSEFFRL